jgi:hypothetical protein
LAVSRRAGVTGDTGGAHALDAALLKLRRSNPHRRFADAQQV